MHHVESSVVERKHGTGSPPAKQYKKEGPIIGVENFIDLHTDWKSSWYTAHSSEDRLVGWNLTCFSPAGPHTVSWNSLQPERNPSIVSDTSSTHTTPVEEISGNCFWMYWCGRKMNEQISRAWVSRQTSKKPWKNMEKKQRAGMISRQKKTEPLLKRNKHVKSTTKRGSSGPEDSQSLF